MAAQSDEDPNGKHGLTGWATHGGRAGGGGLGAGQSRDVTMEEGGGQLWSINVQIELKRPFL